MITNTPSASTLPYSSSSLSNLQNLNQLQYSLESSPSQSTLLLSLIESINLQNLNLYYHDSIKAEEDNNNQNSNLNCVFKSIIDKLNVTFYIESEKLNECKSPEDVEKVHNKLFFILFKQISVYIEEIERLNKKIIELNQKNGINNYNHNNDKISFSPPHLSNALINNSQNNSSINANISMNNSNSTFLDGYNIKNISSKKSLNNLSYNNSSSSKHLKKVSFDEGVNYSSLINNLKAENKNLEKKLQDKIQSLEKKNNEIFLLKKQIILYKDKRSIDNSLIFNKLSSPQTSLNVNEPTNKSTSNLFHQKNSSKNIFLYNQNQSHGLQNNNSSKNCSKNKKFRQSSNDISIQPINVSSISCYKSNNSKIKRNNSKNYSSKNTINELKINCDGKKKQNCDLSNTSSNLSRQQQDLGEECKMLIDLYNEELNDICALETTLIEAKTNIHKTLFGFDNNRYKNLRNYIEDSENFNFSGFMGLNSNSLHKRDFSYSSSANRSFNISTNEKHEETITITNHNNNHKKNKLSCSYGKNKSTSSILGKDKIINVNIQRGNRKENTRKRSHPVAQIDL